MTLIHISLIAKEEEHLLVFLWALWVSSSVNCLFVPFASFLIELFISFLLIYPSSIHSLDPTPVSVIQQGVMVCFNFQKRGAFISSRPLSLI